MVVSELITKLGFNIDASKLDQYTKGVEHAAKKLEHLGEKMSRIGSRMALIVEPIAGFMFFEAIKEASELNTALALVDNTLKNQGESVGYTRDQLRAMAEDQSKNTLIDEADVLRNVTPVLLRLKNIRGEVFEQAQKSVIDLSQALGMDLQSAAKQVGVALQSPAEGVMTLRKQGLKLTEQQVEQIKNMQESGDLMGAQVKYLEALQNGYKGAAEAMAKANALGMLKKQWKELSQDLGVLLLPYVEKFTRWLTVLVEKFRALTPFMKQGLLVLGGMIVAIPLVIMGLGWMASAIAALGTAFAFMGTAAGAAWIAAAWPVALVVAAIIAAIAGIALLVDDFDNWKLGNGSVLGDMLGDFKTFVAGLRQISDDFMNLPMIKFFTDKAKAVEEQSARESNFDKTHNVRTRSGPSMPKWFTTADNWAGEMLTQGARNLNKFELNPASILMNAPGRIRSIGQERLARESAAAVQDSIINLTVNVPDSTTKFNQTLKAAHGDFHTSNVRP